MFDGLGLNNALKKRAAPVVAASMPQTDLASRELVFRSAANTFGQLDRSYLARCCWHATSPAMW